MERLRRTASHVVASSRAAATSSSLVDVASLPPVESDEHYEEAGWRIYRQVLDGGLIGEAKQHISWLGEQHPELRPEQYGHTLVREPASFGLLVRKSAPLTVEIALQVVSDLPGLR